MFTTINYFLENLDIIKAVELGLDIKILSLDEIYALSFFSSILNLFYQLTLQLSSVSSLISIYLTDNVPIDSSKIIIDFNIPKDIRKKNLLKETLFTPSFLNALEKSRTLLGKYWTRLNNIDILYNSMLLDPRFKQQRLKDNVDAKKFQKILEDKRKILKESILVKLTSDSFIINIISNVNNRGGQPSSILHLQSKSKSLQQILHLQNKGKQQPTDLESQLNFDP